METISCSIKNLFALLQSRDIDRQILHQVTDETTVSHLKTLWAGEFGIDDKKMVLCTLSGLMLDNDIKIISLPRSDSRTPVVHLNIGEGIDIGIREAGAENDSISNITICSYTMAQNLIDLVVELYNLEFRQFRLLFQKKILDLTSSLVSQHVKQNSLIEIDFAYEVSLIDGWNPSERSVNRTCYGSETISVLQEGHSFNYQRLMYDGLEVSLNETFLNLFGSHPESNERQIVGEECLTVSVDDGGTIYDLKVWPSDQVSSLFHPHRSPLPVLINGFLAEKGQSFQSAGLGPSQTQIVIDPIFIRIQINEDREESFHSSRAATLRDLIIRLRKDYSCPSALSIYSNGMSLSEMSRPLKDYASDSMVMLRVAPLVTKVNIAYRGVHYETQIDLAVTYFSEIISNLKLQFENALINHDAILKCAGCDRKLTRHNESLQPIPDKCCPKQSLDLMLMNPVDVSVQSKFDERTKKIVHCKSDDISILDLKKLVSKEFECPVENLRLWVSQRVLEDEQQPLYVIKDALSDVIEVECSVKVDLLPHTCIVSRPIRRWLWPSNTVKETLSQLVKDGFMSSAVNLMRKSSQFESGLSQNDTLWNWGIRDGDFLRVIEEYGGTEETSMVTVNLIAERCGTFYKQTLLIIRENESVASLVSALKAVNFVGDVFKVIVNAEIEFPSLEPTDGRSLVRDLRIKPLSDVIFKEIVKIKIYFNTQPPNPKYLTKDTFYNPEESIISLQSRIAYLIERDENLCDYMFQTLKQRITVHGNTETCALTYDDNKSRYIHIQSGNDCSDDVFDDTIKHVLTRSSCLIAPPRGQLVINLKENLKCLLFGEGNKIEEIPLNHGETGTSPFNREEVVIFFQGYRVMESQNNKRCKLFLHCSRNSKQTYVDIDVGEVIDNSDFWNHESVKSLSGQIWDHVIVFLQIDTEVPRFRIPQMTYIVMYTREKENISFVDGKLTREAPYVGNQWMIAKSLKKTRSALYSYFQTVK